MRRMSVQDWGMAYGGSGGTGRVNSMARAWQVSGTSAEGCSLGKMVRWALFSEQWGAIESSYSEG